MLKRVHIDNYKCLTNFDLCFGDLTLLLGTNRCGKSAVFEVVGKLRPSAPASLEAACREYHNVF